MYVHTKKKREVRFAKGLKSSWNWIIYKNIESMLYKVTISLYVLPINKVQIENNIKQTDTSLILEPLSNNGE